MQSTVVIMLDVQNLRSSLTSLGGGGHSALKSATRIWVLIEGAGNVYGCPYGERGSHLQLGVAPPTFSISSCFAL